MRRSLLFFIMSTSAVLAADVQTDAAAGQKEAIQGTYLVDTGAFLNDSSVVYKYPKYKISGNMFTEYAWNESQKAWDMVYSIPYKLVYCADADYMTGYNIVINHPDGYVMRLCTGDVNGDGIMDLWCSDSLFYTKIQSHKRK